MRSRERKTETNMQVYAVTQAARLARCLLFFVVIAVLCLSGSAIASTFSGKVVGVTDGDTITVLQDKTPVKIRLYGIDCPESHQDFGAKAKNATSSLTFGKFVSVEAVDRDRYGRTIGIVTLPGNVNLNQELVKQGMAWWYREYAATSKELPRLEEQARTAKVGLWSQINPTPPWDFRKLSAKPATRAAEPRAAQAPAQPMNTGTVYITATGSKYHAAGCRSLSRSSSPLSQSQALSRGYSACKVCL